MSGYLNLARRVVAERAHDGDGRRPVRDEASEQRRVLTRKDEQATTKTTETTKALAGAYATADVLEDIRTAKTGAALQAGLYRDGRISRENAIQWIACAIIRGREGKEAPFSEWERHAQAVEEALDRFCEGEG